MLLVILKFLILVSCSDPVIDEDESTVWCVKEVLDISSGQVSLLSKVKLEFFSSSGGGMVYDLVRMFPRRR